MRLQVQSFRVFLFLQRIGDQLPAVFLRIVQEGVSHVLSQLWMQWIHTYGSCVNSRWWLAVRRGSFWISTCSRNSIRRSWSISGATVAPTSLVGQTSANPSTGLVLLCFFCAFSNIFFWVYSANSTVSISYNILLCIEEGQTLPAAGAEMDVYATIYTLLMVIAFITAILGSATFLGRLVRGGILRRQTASSKIYIFPSRVL